RALRRGHDERSGPAAMDPAVVRRAGAGRPLCEARAIGFGSDRIFPAYHAVDDDVVVASVGGVRGASAAARGARAQTAGGILRRRDATGAFAQTRSRDLRAGVRGQHGPLRVHGGGAERPGTIATAAGDL